VGTREQILDAAADVMRTQGYAKATTKSIARAAGYSEAALYKHFADKSEILLAVVHERLPELVPALQELLTRVGKATVRTNLVRVTRTALDFYTDGFPILMSLFSSQDLLSTHRARMAELNAGPHKAQEALVRYLRAEQRLGRIRRTADVESAAALLFGACFQHGFDVNFTGRRPSGEHLDAKATSLVRTICDSLRPA
jgi:AcrR family transcriptional regulator